MFRKLGDGMRKVQSKRPPQLRDLIGGPVLKSYALKWGHEDGHHLLQYARPNLIK